MRATRAGAAACRAPGAATRGAAVLGERGHARERRHRRPRRDSTQAVGAQAPRAGQSERVESAAGRGRDRRDLQDRLDENSPCSAPPHSRPPRPPPPPADKAGGGKWVLAAPTPQLVGEQFLRTIVATATLVVPKVIDFLLTLPEVDPARLAITGASTNGFIALQAISTEPRLSVAVAIAACGDFFRFLRYSSMGMEGRPLDLDPEYASWLRAQQPIAHAQRLVHAAPLRVNRTEDPIIPIACADETERVLAPVYARSGFSRRFRYVRVTDAAGHGLGPREDAENRAWLGKWLLGAR